MPQVDNERAERFARIALVSAMVISAALILGLGRDLWFWVDELDWLVGFDNFEPRSLLTPHASHLIAVPRVIYELLPRIFGVDYVPFRILAVFCVWAIAVLVFHLVRRRVGPVLALLPAVLLLFFGSGQDVMISPLGIPFTLSIALGLGALAAVERRTLSGDLAAMVLLTLSIFSHTFGTIVGVGIAVYYVLERGRRREVWVAVIPLLLWFAWWLWARQFDQELATSSNLLSAPLFVVKAASAVIEGMFGIPPDLGGHAHPLALALKIVFAAVAVAGGALLAVRLATGRGTPWTWAYLVTALAFWAGIGLSESAVRTAATPRYLLFGTIMVVLILAEVFREHEFSRRAVQGAFAVFAVCLVGNLSLLIYESPGFSDDARNVKAQLGAIDIGGAGIEPDFRASSLDPPASEYVTPPAYALERFTTDIGPLGDSVDELRDQPEDVRRGADFVLIRGLRITSAEIPAKGGLRTASCVVHQPAPDGYTNFELAPGLEVIELVRDTGTPGAELDLGRFADIPDVSIGELREGRQSVVLVPDDTVGAPWKGRTTGTVKVCRGLSPQR